MVLGVIPARYSSSRLPGKPLALIAGEPMIAHVWRRARETACLDRVVVATDDERILRAAREFGAEAMMTSPNHRSGTDRLAEVAHSFPDAEILANLQGDEPMLNPKSVELMVGALRESAETSMSSLRVNLSDEEALDPNIVKVVVDRYDVALYFSRARIPFSRDGVRALSCYRHLGLYAYRRDFLLTFADLPQSALERTEQLEQLRALENGYRIRVPLTEWVSVSVDTPADLEKVRVLMAAESAAP